MRWFIPDQNFVRRNRFFQHWWKRVGVGLLGRLHAEVDEWFEQRLDLWAGYLGDAAFKDEGDAGARCNLSGVRSYWMVIDLDVAQEAMFRIRSAVEVQDDAVSLESPAP